MVTKERRVMGKNLARRNWFENMEMDLTEATSQASGTSTAKALAIARKLSKNLEAHKRES